MGLRKVNKRSHNEVRQLVTIIGGTSTTSTSTRPQMPPPTGPGVTLSHTTTTTSSSITSTSTTQTSSTSRSTTTSVATTPPAVTSSRPTSNTVVQVTRTSTHHASSTSAAPSATSTESSGMGIGSIAGIGVAAIVAIGVLTAFLVWLIRRRKKNRDIDEEPFNRNSFLRHSTAIPDDDDTGLPPLRRPAPDMIERQPTPSYGGMQTYNNASPQNAFGYNTQPSYQPGAVIFSPNSATSFGPGGAPATPLPYNPGFGYDQQDYGRQASNNPAGYAELTRGGPDDPSYYSNQQHSYDGHFSPPHSPHAPIIPPKDGIYTPASYPELTPATSTAQQGRVISVPETAYDGRETPVQLGFTPAQQNNVNHGPPHGKNRPETVYDPEDAYGGI